MPTYEYACTKCGQHVEVFQRLAEPPLTECGVCGGPLRKVFHPVGIVFKGSGFYATDSRTKPKTSSGGANEGGGKESGGKESKEGGGKEGKDGGGKEGSSASSPSSSSDAGSAPSPHSTSGEKAS
jgi:putative FmdB family regulatory protein